MNHYTRIPDFSDPRYLDEVGWFLCHEVHRRESFGGSYDDERLHYSALLRDEALALCGRDADWLANALVASVGCGCTGDLATFDAAAKIAIDPLVYAYDRLDLLLPDSPGLAPTVYLPCGGESLPLLDASVDLLICCNALDHMPSPRAALDEFRRVLKPDGRCFLSVDFGGVPTPDEPSVFADAEAIDRLLADRFTVIRRRNLERSSSRQRSGSVRLALAPIPLPTAKLDKSALLQAYLARHSKA